MDVGKLEVDFAFNATADAAVCSGLANDASINKFSKETIEVIKKRDRSGWNSLSPKEARIWWDFKYAIPKDKYEEIVSGILKNNIK